MVMGRDEDGLAIAAEETEAARADAGTKSSG